MSELRAVAGSGVVVLLGLFLGTASPSAAQEPSAPAPAVQAPAEPAISRKSVYGNLSSVDKSLNGIIMKSDGGERLAWRLDPRVINEAARFKPGVPMIVIYRQVSPSEKRVTALAFPGSAARPTYVNTTGSRVVVRSSAAADGVCGPTPAGPVSESTLPAGGRAEILEACWCCAAPGETCVPSNKSGQGRALLVQCFE